MAGASRYLAGMTDASEKLEGFGGWLLLVAIGQWLGVFGTLGDFLMELPNYAAQWSDPAVRRGVVGEAALDAGLVAFMLYTAIMMNMKRHEFPTLFRLQLALVVVLPVLSILWMSRSTGHPLGTLDFAATAAQAVVGVIGASISILYSLRSERVRNTFVY
jgi:hypothetical protein